MDKINVKLYPEDVMLCHDFIRTEIRELEKAFPKINIVKDCNYRYFHLIKYKKVLVNLAGRLKKALKNKGYNVVDIC